RFWRAYGFAAFAVGLGYFVQLVVTARGPVPPALLLGGPVTAALLGVGTLAVVVVMCTYPLRITSRRAWACFWLDMATVMVGAGVQRWQVGTDPGALRRGARRPYSTLPYLALGASFTLLVVALFGHGLDGRTWAVLVGVVTSTGLIVIRQLASFSENARLLGELRAALHERDLLAAELRDMAFRDGLTGLANRPLFHHRLATALTRVRRGRAQIAVM